MRKKLGIVAVAVLLAAAAFIAGVQLRQAAEPPAAETAAEPPAEQPSSTPAPSSQPEAAPASETASRKPARTPRPASPPPPSEPAAPESAPAPPEPAAETSATRPTEARLARREAKPAGVKVRLAEGTKIVFTLNDRLSTKDNRAGDPFSGVVSRSVRVGDVVAVPEGSVVRGQVTRVERAGRVKGRAELSLRFDQLELPEGQVYDLAGSLTELDEREKEKVTEEGQVEGEGTKKRDVLTIGSGAGIGAAIGAIAGGGGKGAATGGAVGAGAGTAVVLLTRGKDVEIARGTELALQLNRPLTVEAR